MVTLTGLNRFNYMNSITTLSGKPLSKIGIGTYGIGGRGHRDMPHTEVQDDITYINALSYQFEKGYNFTEISLGYGHGHAVRLFSQALKEGDFDRKDLFITNALYPRDLNSFDEVKNDVDSMYEIFDTDYFDSTLVTQSLCTKFGFENVESYLKELLANNKTRYISLSNASPAFIEKCKSIFGSSLFAHETHLSFEVRINQDKGVFETCNRLGVENIIWRPLRRNNTISFNWELLQELSDTYKKTQNQIVLNWITQLGYRPMVFSTSPKHIDENWESTEFSMEPKDYTRINNFRIPNLSIPTIDWEKTGDGISMTDFAVGFENYYQNQG